MHVRSCVVQAAVPGTLQLALESGRAYRLPVRCPVTKALACPAHSGLHQAQAAGRGSQVGRCRALPTRQGRVQHRRV